VHDLVSASNLDLAQGDPAELVGFDVCDPERVLARLSEY
jgi:hypothetical protein